MSEASWFSIFILNFCVCVVASAQTQESQSKGGSCPNPHKITLDKAGADATGEAWTNETANRDGLLSLTYCWMFQNGATTVSRLSQKNMLELPTGFEPHIKYGQMVGEKIISKSFLWDSPFT